MNNYWIDADLERMNKSLQDIEHETAPVRWSALSKSGIQSICIPSEFGGMGLGVVAAQSAFESAGRILSDQSLAFSFAAHVSAFQFPVSLFATQQLKKQTLRKCVEGSLIGSFAATEHEAGSDIANISTEYVSCPSGFRLSGRKEFVTNAPISNSVLVLATRNKSLGLAGLSAFVVDTSLPGVIRSAPLEMQGQNAALIGSITLSDCIVPKVALLGTHFTSVECSDY
jgi:clorobiocin biosynthesis protein CloN3